MNWAGKQHPVDTVVECIAPIPLALTAGWACGVFGLSMVESAAVAVVIFTAGCAAIRIAGKESVAHFDFEPGAVEAEDSELGELLLEEKDELLELTDPLADVMPDSRVVRLFARQEATPGELLNRITGFLADGRPAETSSASPGPAAPVDSSAALHAALANIRASLR